MQKRILSGQVVWKIILAAFVERAKDIEVLDKAGRKIAAMHVGGIAIECLLKHMIFTTLPKGATWEWKTDTNNPGHTLRNPGHSYDAALRCHNHLRSQIKQFSHILGWLKAVEYPDGYFIDICYVGKEPDEATYKQWWYAYRRLLDWLRAYRPKNIKPSP